MKKETFLILFLLISFFKTFSQSGQVVSIVDSCANYSNNINYNTGEVYVTFIIQNNPIYSKQPNTEENTYLTDALSSGILIYPNPSSDYVNIFLPDKNKTNKILLFDVEGKLVLEQELQNNQLNIKHLPIGTYILKTIDSENNNYKIIKQ